MCDMQEYSKGESGIDVLTGVLNRSALEESVSHMISDGKMHAFILFDFDGNIVWNTKYDKNGDEIKSTNDLYKLKNVRKLSLHDFETEKCRDFEYLLQMKYLEELAVKENRSVFKQTGFLLRYRIQSISNSKSPPEQAPSDSRMM